MAEHKTGCLICGEALMYGGPLVRRCFYCSGETETTVACVKGHYVCDGCHSGSANDLIQRFCSAADSTSPLEMAVTLMRSPQVKMHGPEHHFLVPAVLLCAYYNRFPDGREEKVEKIAIARRRAEDIKGGFCGFYGNCGAAVGTGIFLSVMTGATPLSTTDWRLCNLMTGEALVTIANHGGPRCCKRDTFLALRAAVDFLRREFQVKLDMPEEIVCEFRALNKECTHDACPFCDVNQVD